MASEMGRDRVRIQAVARLTLGAIWVYHGLVLKLLFPNRAELAALHHAGVFFGHDLAGLRVSGLLEAVWGAAHLAASRARAVLTVDVAALILLVPAAVILQPRILLAPFNPLTLNGAMIALAVIGLACEPAQRAAKTKKPLR